MISAGYVSFSAALVEEVSQTVFLGGSINDLEKGQMAVADPLRDFSSDFSDIIAGLLPPSSDRISEPVICRI
jgi:hypothetical protein